MRIPVILCGLGLGVGLVAGGCKPEGSQDTEPGTSEEGETGTCTPGAEGCLCGEDASCEPGLLCASNTCIPQDGVTTTTGTTPAGTTSTESSGESSSPTETGGDSTGGTETGDTECDPGMGLINPGCTDPKAPYCDANGSCVGCDAVTCGEVSSATPTCDMATGHCVQCTETDAAACAGTTPICDVAAAMCIGCSAHEDCKDSACQFDTGACYGAALFVERGADCANADGSAQLPYCEIGDATAKLGAEPTAILVKPSLQAYTEQIQIGPGRTAAIVRNGSGTVRLEVADLDSIQISDGATVQISALTITKGDVAKGVFCSAAKVSIDHTQFVERKGLGIEAVNCDLTVRESRVWQNFGGGIKVNGGKLRLENSFVVTNGGSFSMVSGLVISNGATVDVVYTTIADNDGGAGVADSIDCTAVGPVKLRNSIVFGQSEAGSVDCASAAATTSVFDSPTLIGDGNVMEPALDPSWFVAPETGNFAIKVGPPFDDVAIWLDGDPTRDYDGDMRPGQDGAKDYAGADRPK